MPSGSSGVAGFTGVRPRSHRVHPGSLDSVGYARSVFVFIQGHWVYWWVSSGSSFVAGFSGVRPVLRRVHSGSLGSL